MNIPDDRLFALNLTIDQSTRIPNSREQKTEREKKNCKHEVSEACKLNIDLIIKMQSKIITKPVELRDRE